MAVLPRFSNIGMASSGKAKPTRVRMQNQQTPLVKKCLEGELEHVRITHHQLN